MTFISLFYILYKIDLRNKFSPSMLTAEFNKLSLCRMLDCKIRYPRLRQGNEFGSFTFGSNQIRMPNIKSAKKALRQSIKRRKINLKRKDDLKEVIKQYKKLTATNKEEAKKYLSQVYKKLDKTAKVNLIKKNKANRLKSRLAKLVK